MNNDVRLSREAVAEAMVNDMVSWLRRNGKSLCERDTGQIRFYWDGGSPKVKVSYSNSEDITRKI